MKCPGSGPAILVATSLLASTALADTPGPLTPRPNVLVIVIDDIGVDKIAAYNPTIPAFQPPTPRLSGLAAQGVRFTEAYAQPKCSPSRASIMSGRYAFHTGCGENIYRLDESEATIAERLRDGFPNQPVYRRGAFGKWHMTPKIFDYPLPCCDYDHPILQGFEKFVGEMGNLGQADEGSADQHHFYWKKTTSEVNQPYQNEYVGHPVAPYDDAAYATTVIRQEAVQWINQQTQPFFAYICFPAGHAPFQVPPLSTVSSQTAATITALGYAPGAIANDSNESHLFYNWMIESVDTEIGNLLDSIESVRYSNTTVLIVGDNGTPGSVIADPPYDSDHGKGTVYEQGTLVPLITAGRGVSQQGATCSGLVHTVDFLPTIVAMTGAQVSGGPTSDGVSFWNMMVDPTAASARTKVFVQHFTPSSLGPWAPSTSQPPAGISGHERGMRDTQYKYIRKYQSGITLVTEEAYDLAADPYETNNLWPTLNSLPLQVRQKILALKTAMIALSGY